LPSAAEVAEWCDDRTNYCHRRAAPPPEAPPARSPRSPEDIARVQAVVQKLTARLRAVPPSPRAQASRDDLKRGLAPQTEKEQANEILARRLHEAKTSSASVQAGASGAGDAAKLSADPPSPQSEGLPTGRHAPIAAQAMPTV
jgi:hypothetical protein